MNVEPYIVTRGGRKFSFVNPKPEDVDLGDIAHALSHANRFTGHTYAPWTVAQHSLLVSELCWYETRDNEVALHGLFHDAAEAYVGDISSPLKTICQDIVAVHNRIQGVIAERFRLLPAELHSPVVHKADQLALALEFWTFFPHIPIRRAEEFGFPVHLLNEAAYVGCLPGRMLSIRRLTSSAGAFKSEVMSLFRKTGREDLATEIEGLKPRADGLLSEDSPFQSGPVDPDGTPDEPSVPKHVPERSPSVEKVDPKASGQYRVETPRPTPESSQ